MYGELKKSGDLTKSQVLPPTPLKNYRSLQNKVLCLLFIYLFIVFIL